PEADEAAPVLADERDPAQVERFEQAAHPIDVALVGVLLATYGLVGASEPDQVRRDDAMAGARDDRDHLPVEVGPGRLAVQHQYGWWPHAVPRRRSGRGAR